MKRDLRFIVITLNVLAVFFIVYTTLLAAAACFNFTIGEGVHIREPLLSQFQHYTTTTSNTSVIIFLVLNSLLNAFMAYILLVLKNALSAVGGQKLFTAVQVTQLKKAGNGLIAYALLKYLLYCFFGFGFFMSPLIFLKALMPFIVVSLLGRLALVVAHMAKKGEALKEENELTI